MTIPIRESKMSGLFVDNSHGSAYTVNRGGAKWREMV